MGNRLKEEEKKRGKPYPTREVTDEEWKRGTSSGGGNDASPEDYDDHLEKDSSPEPSQKDS
jgi:hypothetical protein